MRLQRGLPKLRSISQIQSPHALKILKGCAFAAFQAKYCPEYAWPITAPEKIMAQYHACKLPVIDHYQTRSDPLWWTLVLSKVTAGSKKAMIRQAFQKKVRHAFIKALESAGYNKDGTKIPEVNKDGMDLRGTACLVIQPGILTADKTTLEANSKTAVEAIVAACKTMRVMEKGKKTRPMTQVLRSELKEAGNNRSAKQSSKSLERDKAQVARHQVHPFTPEQRGLGNNRSLRLSFKGSDRENEQDTRKQVRPTTSEQKEAGKVRSTSNSFKVQKREKQNATSHQVPPFRPELREAGHVRLTFKSFKSPEMKKANVSTYQGLPSTPGQKDTGKMSNRQGRYWEVQNLERKRGPGK